MKLDKLKLGLSQITNEVFIYEPDKNNELIAKNKKVVTNDFLFVLTELLRINGHKGFSFEHKLTKQLFTITLTKKDL